MPNVNFYLKKPEGNPARSLIYLQFNYSGKKLIYSFGQNIDPAKSGKQYKYWSKEKKRVKSNSLTTADGKHSLNGLLDNLEEACLKAYNNELSKGIRPITVLTF